MNHLSVDDLGDLPAVEADPHVAACAQCRRVVDDQLAVRELLAALPDPGEAPPDVVHAIVATLRELGGPGRARPTVLPLANAPSRRVAHRRVGPKLLAAAAAALVVVGGGSQLVQHLPRGGADAASTAGSAAGADRELSARAAPLTTPDQAFASGTAYTRATIVAQVTALLAGQVSRADAATSDLLSTSKGLAGCLRALGTAGPPLAVDLATYEGKPAAVVVLPTKDGRREVWVVARSCRPSADGTLFYTRLP